MLDIQRQQGRVTLVGRLQIEFLEEAKPALVQAAQSPGQLDLDLSLVEHVDTAGLQMIVALLQSRSTAKPTSVIGLSAPLARALELTGLDELVASYLA